MKKNARYQNPLRKRLEMSTTQPLSYAFIYVFDFGNPTTEKKNFTQWVIRRCLKMLGISFSMPSRKLLLLHFCPLWADTRPIERN